MSTILPSTYNEGTVAVANGSASVVGVGTMWLNTILPGDFFAAPSGQSIRILEVVDNTHLTLAYVWPGTSLAAGSAYEIRFQADMARMQETSRQLLQKLMNGNIEAFSGLVGAADAIPMFTGPGAMTLVSRGDLVAGINFDVEVDNLAARAPYDNEATGFTVLVADVGDGRAAIYYKKSVASADWSNPAYITGPRGLTWRDVWDNATAYVKDDAVSYNGASYIALTANTNVTPVAGATWGLLATRGATGLTGVNPRGNYSGATAYAVSDAVLYNGSTFVCIAATTGNAPPTLPTTSNTWWQLLAQKGTDGTGIGDVVGPAGATDNAIVAFDGTTGKLVKQAPSGSIANSLLANMAAGTIKGRRLADGNGAPQNLTPAQARGELSVENLTSIRNRLVNGGFDVWQRGLTFTTPANGAYVADGWQVGYDAAGTFFLSGVAATNEAINAQTWRYLRWNQTAAATATFRQLISPIENVHTLAGQTVTVTFEAWATAAQTISANLRQNFGTGGSPSSSVSIGAQNVSLTTTPQKFSLTFAVPDVKTKTLGSNGNDRLELILGLPLTGTFDIKISRVSVVAGDATQEADPFGPGLDYARILSACERYYQSLYLTWAPYAATTAVQAIGSNFRTTMRVAPTSLGGSVISSSAGTAVSGYDNITPQGARMTVVPGGANGVYAIAVVANFTAEF